MTVDSASTITLFKGAKLYTIPGGGAVTLQDAFIGARVASADGRIALGTENAGSYYNFEHFSVRTSAAIVGTSGTPVNRSIESFVNQSGVAAFLRSLRSDSTTTSATTTANASSSIAPVTVNVSMLGSQRASTTSDLERFAVNGNKNVLAIKNGDLTVECAPGKSTFEMTGVRTVLVENGNIIFKCNTSYASNDTTSSWAWIVKGGDIKVYNGIGVLSDGAVTNISGIYVAIKDSTGGDITYTGNTTTQKILKIEGSLYGNASPLFRSRLYARGTSAYDILTTGTIISYSNRALVSPPPLLSQYLNNYSVQRVVR